MRWMLAMTAAVVGCGPTPKSGVDARGDGLGDAGGGPTIDGDYTPIDAGQCGAQMANIGVVNLGDPPDLLVVLDRSGSMSEIIPAFPPTFVTKCDVRFSYGCPGPIIQ